MKHLTTDDRDRRRSRVPIPAEIPAVTRAALAVARLGDAWKDGMVQVIERDHDGVRHEREWRDRDLIARALTGAPAPRERHPETWPAQS